MMGAEPPMVFEPPPPKEELETLTLSDHQSNYQSAMSSIHNGDPLLTPPPTIQIPTQSSSPSSSSSSFVDPPSYNEAVSCPFHSPPSFSSSSTPKRSHISDYIRIAVTDPRKEQDTAPTSLVPGSATFVSYLITSTIRDSTEFRVRRRFRDFITLADRLADSHRGLFIPPRPDKNTVESQMMQKQEFVEQRRAQLEKYLWRLAVHPAVGKSEELKLFLRAQGKLPLAATTDIASRMLDGAVRLPKQLMGEGAVVARDEVAQPAKGGRDLLRIFKELKQSVTNDWGGVRPTVAEEDREFLERKEKVQDLEQQLLTSSQQAEALVKVQHDMGEAVGELGLTFIKLVKLENEEATYNSQRTRAADLKLIATAAVKASRLYRELNAQTVRHLGTLHEYLGMMLAVRSAFSDRSNALLTVQTLSSDLCSLHTRAEKLEVASSKIFGGDESRIRKLEEVRKTIRATEDAKSCAVGEYERIKENNRCELERLDMERREDFLGMLKGLVVNQVSYAEKIASVWAKAAEETSQYARDKV